MMLWKPCVFIRLNVCCRYLVVQHGERVETLQDARLKEVWEDPDHGHVNITADWEHTNVQVSRL